MPIWTQSGRTRGLDGEVVTVLAARRNTQLGKHRLGDPSAVVVHALLSASRALLRARQPGATCGRAQG